MTAPPIKIELTYEERRALEELAVAELRRPPDMLRWLLREELKRRKINGAVTNLTGSTGAVDALTATACW